MQAELLGAAKEKAQSLGVSLAEYVRGLLREDLELTSNKKPKGDIEAIFDLGSSEQSDIANDKDAMLADALTKDLAK